ncbi:MAG: hypothetical protein ACHQT8_00115 [Chlamydiales bacterium]
MSEVVHLMVIFRRLDLSVTGLECNICRQAADAPFYAHKINIDEKGQDVMGHPLDEECLKVWLRTCAQKRRPATCPLCRAKIDPKCVNQILPKPRKLEREVFQALGTGINFAVVPLVATGAVVAVRALADERSAREMTGFFPRTQEVVGYGATLAVFCFAIAFFINLMTRRYRSNLF